AVVSIPALSRFGGMPLEALGRSRVFPAPGLAGDGGGGCAAFNRSAVTPGRWLARYCCAWRSRPDVLGRFCCRCCWDEYDLYSHPRPLLSLFQSYSPSSTSPAFLRACDNRSLR